MKKIEIDVCNLTNKSVPSRTFFQKIAQELVIIERLRRFRALKTRYLRVSLVFISASVSRRLNKAWRKKDKPAATLTFSLKPELRAPKLSEFYLGEIFISPVVIKEKAVSLGKSFQGELTRCFAHAMLHLLGYNHEGRRGDEAIMSKIETQLLEKLAYQ